MIAQAATSHDVLARVQALVWVWNTEVEVERVAERELAHLGSEDVVSVDALTIARAAGPVVEVLRAAAELELDALASLEPLPPTALASVEAALARVLPAAPSLAHLDVAIARPLGRRGRVLGTSILIGCPGIGCPEADHAAWQAAHEATVREVACASFHETERRAIARLRSRARAAGLGDAHARWLARLDLSALGPIPDVDDATD